MPTRTKRNLRPKKNGTSRHDTSPEPRLAPTGVEVQRFGTLRLLPIALSAAARQESSQLLNAILADTMILYALYKKHHWLVAGPTFYQLHLLFDKHAEEQPSSSTCSPSGSRASVVSPSVIRAMRPS